MIYHAPSIWLHERHIAYLELTGRLRFLHPGHSSHLAWLHVKHNLNPLFAFRTFEHSVHLDWGRGGANARELTMDEKSKPESMVVLEGSENAKLTLIIRNKKGIIRPPRKKWQL